MKKLLMVVSVLSLIGCTNTKERKMENLTGDMYIASHSLEQVDKNPTKQNIEQAKHDVANAYNSAVSASHVKNLSKNEAINVNVSKQVLLNTYNNLFKMKVVK